MNELLQKVYNIKMSQLEYDLTLKLNYITVAMKSGQTELEVPANWDDEFINFLKEFGFIFFERLDEQNVQLKFYMDLINTLPEGSLNYTFINIHEQKSPTDLLEFLANRNANVVKVKYSKPKTISKGWKVT